MRTSQISSPITLPGTQRRLGIRGTREAEVTKRIAAPMAGSVITSFVLELLIYPPAFTIWKWWAEVRPAQRENEGV